MNVHTSVFDCPISKTVSPWTFGRKLPQMWNQVTPYLQSTFDFKLPTADIQLTFVCVYQSV